MPLRAVGDRATEAEEARADGSPRARDASDSQHLNYQAVSQRNTMAKEEAAYLDLDAFYKTTPPPFGHGLRKFFGFDSRYTNLNNGKSAP